MQTTLHGTTTASSTVWDRLWQHEHSAEKDNALLARERRSSRWQLIVRRVEAALGSLSELRTVELGCGRGDLSALFAQRGAQVTLLDANTSALDQAKSRFERLGLPATYRQADMLDTRETRRERFDVVVSSGVIEHFEGEDRTRAIRAHYEALRPGGMTIISVPHAWCLPYRMWKRYLELRGWWPYGPELPYTRREMVHRARVCGFRQCETHSVGFLQSVGGHWWRTVFGRRPGWIDRRCILDGAMGFTLLLFARRGGT